MKGSNASQWKKYFHTKDKWIEISLPDKKPAKRRTELVKGDEVKAKKSSKHAESTEETWRQCIEYWDSIKEKYKYNHLYRKRVLRIKQEDLEKSIDNKTRINSLLNKEGEIRAQYVNKSKDIDVKGQGVRELLNGRKDETPVEESETPQESTKSSKAAPSTDLIEDVKKCLVVLDPLHEADISTGDWAKQESAVEAEDRACRHFLKREHRKLFMIPECVEDESVQEESSVEPPTVFDWCMKDLHEEAKRPSPEESIESSVEIVDPWLKLNRRIKERYGYSDRDLREEEKAVVVEGEYSDGDFYEKIVSNVLEKELRAQGEKKKVRTILSDPTDWEIADSVRTAELTLKGKGGEYLQGLDLRREKKNDTEAEGDVMTHILSSLMGEWTTMKTFLTNLAEKTPAGLPKQPHPIKKKSEGKRVLGPLGKNVRKMVSEIVEEGREENEARDVDVNIRYDPVQYVAPIAFQIASPMYNADKENTLGFSYREKTDYKIEKDRTGKRILSKQIARKKELTVENTAIRTDSSSHIVPSLFEDCKCAKTHQSESVSISGKPTVGVEKPNHRGVVELISGGMYAGSWNHLGMEGCGKYISPGGTIIDGNMSDGVLDGPATVYLPNGIVIAGAFNKGKFHSPKIEFGDGVEYKHENWDYLSKTKKLTKSELRRSRPILDREIPEGCYDTGEGFYNPSTKLLYHPVSMTPLRCVSEKEEKWIVSICRSARPKCVSLSEHLYERADIPTSRRRRGRGPAAQDGAWGDCRSPRYSVQPDEETSGAKVSLDRLIQIEKKSRPVEEIWNSVKYLIGNQKAKVAVPFSFERAVQYTCNDEHLLHKLLSTAH